MWYHLIDNKDKDHWLVRKGYLKNFCYAMNISYSSIQHAYQRGTITPAGWCADDFRITTKKLEKIKLNIFKIG